MKTNTELSSELLPQARNITRQRFGRTMKLYVPIYLSSHCVNNCPYCSFSSEIKNERTHLSINEVLSEAEALISKGFQHILLVSGEDPKNVTVDYLCEIAKRLRPKIANLQIEVQPFDYLAYKKMSMAGIDGVTLYQETYDRIAFKKYHTKGSKSDYDLRLQTMDFAAKAGMRFLGIGALLGLADWKYEFNKIIEHANYLSKTFWKAHISISFPRIQPNKNAFKAPFLISDDELALFIANTRIARPDDDLVLSTRESVEIRNKLLEYGITRISAESKTAPGSYSINKNNNTQFEVADLRSAQEVADDLKNMNYDVVWKDWV